MACLSTQTITSTILTSWNTTCPNGRKNVLQVYWIQEHVFNDVWHSERVGTLLYVIFAQIAFWAVVSGVLHKLGIYWKLWEAEFTSGNRKFDTLFRFTHVIQIFKVCLFMVFFPLILCQIGFVWVKIVALSISNFSTCGLLVEVGTV
jgi:hypothetical protein